MGCDIHLHIEVKIENKWRHYANPDINRNYTLFALMAGVRNYDNIKPISKPKGLPDNLTYITKKDYSGWEVDSHDESWLDVKEIKQIKNRQYDLFDKYVNKPFLLYDLFNNFLFGNSLIAWHEYPQDNHMNIEDLRFVFWFDS